MQTWIPVLKYSTIGTNVPVPVVAGGISLVVVKTNETLSVFQGQCPHQKSPLANGVVKDGVLTCLSHGWRFDCVDGKKLPAGDTCLKKYSHRISDGHLELVREELAGAEPEKTVSRGTRDLKDVSGPPALPFLGNFLQIEPTKFDTIMTNWYGRYGGTYQFKLGRQKMLVIGEVDAIQECLQNRPTIFRRIQSIEDIFSSLKASGVFSSEGKQWARERQLTMPSFNSAHLTDFFPALVKFTNRFLGRLKKLSATGEDIKIQSEFMRYTVDVTTQLAFGYDMNTLENEGDVIQQKLAVLFPAFTFRLSFPIPYWHFFKLNRDRKIDAAIKDIEAIVEEIISETRARMKKNPALKEKPTNFLEGFLAAEDSEFGAMTKGEIFGNVLTILLAGEDTTANAMAWLMHLMLEYPDVQEKVRREVDEVLGEENYPTSLAQLDKLRYLEAVANETLRFYSVAPFVFLLANHDTVVADVRIPKGTGVTLLSQHAQYDERNFTDARKFLPERWLAENRERFPIHNLKAFITFGGGPRFCPGRNLAMMEIKMVLAMFFKHFRVTKPKNGRVMKPKFTFVRVPANLWVQMESRA